MFEFLFNVVSQPFFSPDDGGGNDPTPEPVNPLRDPEPVDEPTEPTEPVEPEEIDFGGRKVKVVDPAIKDLHGDWKELNSTLTKEQQQRKQLEEELEEARKALESSKEPEPSNEPSRDRLQEINEKYVEMAYDDPVGALIWLNQQPEYQQLMKPVHEQNVQTVMTETQMRQAQLANRIKEQAAQLSEKYPDYMDLVAQMDQMVDQYPHLREQMETNPTIELMDSVYWMTKGRTPNPEPVSQGFNLEDENTMKQVMENPKVREAIIKDYLDQVNNNQQVPEVLPSGGQAPTMPDQPLNTIEDGTKAFKAMLRRVGL